MMKSTNSLSLNRKAAVSLTAVYVTLMAAIGASAQTAKPADKSVVVEATQKPVAAAETTAPFFVFGQWLQQVSAPAPAPQVTVPVQVLSFATAPTPQGSFEAPPVILGQPELPLVGQAAAQAAQQWGTGLNYQGLTLSYVVLDKSGHKREIRPIDKGLNPGERFKVRYTTTYPAVAAIERVVGDSPWTSQNYGQAWPQIGTSVQSNPGETVELPLEPGSFFVFDGNPNERFLLTIRHPSAKGEARSNQPAYRQDGARGSQYLQLVPKDTFPAIAQLIATRTPR